MIILLLKYTILKFHFNAVLSRAFSRTFKINQELEEYICVLFFSIEVLRANSLQEKVGGWKAGGVWTSHLLLQLGSPIWDLRYPTFYNHQTCCNEFDWNSNKTLFSVRTIYLNDRQDCKHFYSNLLFSFQQEAGGNEAV